MLSLQIYTHKGKWGVTYLDSINWDNVCELLPLEGRSESTKDMFSCVREHLKEGMGLHMTREDALRLVIEAAEKHVEFLWKQSVSFSYANDDPMEKVYRKAIEILKKEE